MFPEKELWILVSLTRSTPDLARAFSHMEALIVLLIAHVVPMVSVTVLVETVSVKLEYSPMRVALTTLMAPRIAMPRVTALVMETAIPHLAVVSVLLATLAPNATERVIVWPLILRAMMVMLELELVF